MTDPKPQDLADYLASPAGADDLAELQAAMKESEQLFEDPDKYVRDHNWRINKRGHRDYRCSIWYHIETDRELRVADGMGETAQDAVENAVNQVRSDNGKPLLPPYRMTPSERAAQRESFAFGNANASNPEVTREMVREAIAKEDENQ